ncbi:MAG: PD-(D/E)XK nuclease family protein [Thermoplasmata archaeon]|nr:PD-(D/E)XK nuclease family protein [Thermoplasmata archaeon]
MRSALAMTEPSAAGPAPPLRLPVVEADPVLAERLRRAMEAPAGPRLVWVTDLVDPRRAYYHEISPVPATPEVAARRESGRLIHDRVERLLAAPEHREIRVGIDGIVGRIDLLFDRPTELKSTARLPAAADVRLLRPAYVEQLAAYCALLGRAEGRLLLVGSQDSSESEVRALDCEFNDLPGLRAALEQSAQLIRRSVESRDPSLLPRCAWYDRGCEYREAQRCGCTGTEPAGATPGGERLARIERNEPLEAEIGLRLRAPPRPPESEPFDRFSELLFPRQTYFERIGTPKATGREFTGTSLWRRMLAASDSELGTELEERRSRTGEPTEPLRCFRGEPVLEKTTKSRWRTPPERMPERVPHYFTDLALRAGAVGASGGWIVLARELPEPGVSPMEVLHVQVGEPSELARALAERCERLHAAIAQRDPSRLESCPDWMVADCPFRAVCGDPSGRPTAMAGTGR